jgi:N-acetylmuramoyl-L-alanine amidase
MTGTAHAALGDTVLGRGAQDGDVRQLQQYLHQLGLLKVAPTGYFGSLTDAAVRQFQAENGLVADGLVGPLTSAALVDRATAKYYVVQPGDSLWLIANRYSTEVISLQKVNGITTDLIYPGQTLRLPTQAANPSRGNFNHSDIVLVAELVHAEAGGEPYQGKVAVAAVVFNRVDSPLFPNTIRGVIYQPYQFEPVLNGRIYDGFDASDMEATLEALAGSDPTSGALFFYNPGKVSQSWMAARQVIAVIGQHVFSR